MEKSFIFESSHFSHDDLCDRIEITINIEGKSDGTYSWKFESIRNTDDENIEMLVKDLTISSFPPEEQKVINLRAETIASKNAHEAYDDFLEGQEERRFDSYREEIM